MGALTTLLALAITNVSGYCLYHSAQSIPRLQCYEKKAEKAAEWSNVAEKRLWGTRYTVGAGFIMVSASHASFSASHACIPEFGFVLSIP